jgi:hypothetical protein
LILPRRGTGAWWARLAMREFRASVRRINALTRCVGVGEAWRHGRSRSGA